MYPVAWKTEKEEQKQEEEEAAAVNENLSGRQPRSGGFMHGLDKCFMLRLARLVCAYYAKVASVHAAYALFMLCLKYMTYFLASCMWK